MKRVVLLVWAAIGCTGAIGPGSESPALDPSAAPSGPPGSPAAGPGPAAPPTMSAPGAPATAAAACEPPARRIWRLTPRQYLSTLEALLPNNFRTAEDIARTASVGDAPFDDDAGTLTLSTPHVAQLFDNAAALAAGALVDPGKLQPCLAAAAPDRTCVRGFVQGFATRAFRRPALDAEVDAYLAAYDRDASAQGALGALEEVVGAVLMSPSFLFRTELGADGDRGTTTLTPHEAASAVSYLIVDGPPDAELLAAADAGGLRAPAQLEAQARRLLASANGTRGLSWLFAQHLGLARLAQAHRDPKLFPSFTPDLAADMGRELTAFVEQVIQREDGRFATLLNAPWTLANARTAPLYGAKVMGTTTFTKVTPPAGTRAGLLTSPGLMTIYAHEASTDIVRRGRFVRETLLCQTPPPPPPNANAFPPQLDGVHTQREILGSHSSNPACATCHSLLDPLGLAFENYDAIGAYRTTEAGKPIDASGRLDGTSAPPATFRNAVELAGLLAGSEQATACMAGKVLRYAQGRPADACAAAAQQRFSAVQGDLREYLISVVTANDFIQRRVP